MKNKDLVEKLLITQSSENQTLKITNPEAQFGGSSPSKSEFRSSSAESSSTFRDHRVCHFSVETPLVKRRSTGIMAIFSDNRYVKYFSEKTNLASEKKFKNSFDKEIINEIIIRVTI